MVLHEELTSGKKFVKQCCLDEFKVGVKLHQGSVLSPFLFAVVMESLKDEISVQTSPLHFVVSILSFIFVICDVVGPYMVGYSIDCSTYDIICLCWTWYMVKALNVLPLCISTHF